MKTTGFRRSGHAPSLLAALVHFDVSFMVWVLLGALGAYVGADLGLSPAQKGLMVALPPLGGSIFRLSVGSLADRVGMKRTGMITLGLVAVPLLWGWLAARTYHEVLGIGLLLGVAGASFAVALPLASRWYPPEYQGLALGIAGAGNSGTIVAALFAPRLAEHIGWHGVFGLALVPVAVAWLAFLVLAKEPPRPGVFPTDGFRTLLRNGDARWLSLFYVVTFGGYVGFSGYLPIYFVDQFGLPKVTAAGYAAVCAAAGSLLRPVGGWVADKLGGTKVLAAALAVVAVAATALATQPALAATIVLLAVAMGAFGIGNGAVFQIVPQHFPDAIGRMTGLVGAAGGLGGFLLPFGLGALAGATDSYAAGFAGVAAAAIAATAAVALRGRVRRRRLALEPAVS